MGKRGPAPKPTALKKMQGNPGKRPLNASEPRPDAARPRCPSWLRPEAKAEWRRIAARLHQVGLLTSIDGDMLAAYCQLYARWREAEEKVAETSQIIVSKKTHSAYLNPWLNAASMALKEMNKLAAQFGMTPASRSRIHVDKVEEERSLADFLFKAVNDER